MKEIRYHLVVAFDEAELARRVNDFLSLGYKLHGNHCITHSPSGGTIMYSQSVKVVMTDGEFEESSLRNRVSPEEF